MNEIKNLITAMLSNLTDSPENISEIATRDKKLVLLLDSDTKEFGSHFDSIILALKEKEDESDKGTYQNIGYVQKYAEVLDNIGYRLLGIAAASRTNSKNPWTNYILWSSTPQTSIVLFSVILRAWEIIVPGDINDSPSLRSLLENYGSLNPENVQIFEGRKLYTAKSTMMSLPFLSDVIHVKNTESSYGKIYDTIFGYLFSNRRQSINLKNNMISFLKDKNAQDLRPQNVLDFMKKR